MKSVEWEWGHYGRCFIDGKFSHGVRFHRTYDGSFQGAVFETSPEPTGLMLDALGTCKTIEDVVAKCEADAHRVVLADKESLSELKKDLCEYPWHNRKK